MIKTKYKDLALWKSKQVHLIPSPDCLCVFSLHEIYTSKLQTDLKNIYIGLFMICWQMSWIHPLLYLKNLNMGIQHLLNIHELFQVNIIFLKCILYSISSYLLLHELIGNIHSATFTFNDCHNMVNFNPHCKAVNVPNIGCLSL